MEKSLPIIDPDELEEYLASIDRGYTPTDNPLPETDLTYGLEIGE